jgi:phosphoribosylaminoimidazole-succinocarboxamide synthase
MKENDSMKVVTETQIKEFPLTSRGKVRDIYDLAEDRLLIVTTDRMSAFDVIMNEPIPFKGVILNQITMFWMEMFKNIVPNHLIASDVADFPEALAPYAEELEGRAVIVKKAKPLPIECIVRGYITGSGWKDYQRTGSVCGYPLPDGLQESEKLPEPLFTPSTKAELGEHDENITLTQARDLIGADLLDKVQTTSLDIYSRARDFAAEKGILIADTKFEFGMVDGHLTLIDEVLTPDSSRFWPMQGYAPGVTQPSFDKQYLRDWLSKQDWDKTPPPPTLTSEVIEKTGAKYAEAYQHLTGKPFTTV